MKGIENIYNYDIDQYVGKANVLIIDLRSKKEYERRHIKGAINMSIEMIGKNINNFPDNKVIVVYCDRGGRSIIAARILAGYGYQVKNVINGIKNYNGSSLT